MDSPRTPRGLSSPEAKIGLRVEDLWYVQEPMLSPSEKLNSCFESIPVSSFPSAPPSLEIEIPSDASLSDAVDTLSKNKILSAPVRNVDAPEDASWIDRYIGVLEFAGIAVWLLHQTDVAASHGNDFGANSSTEGSFFEYLTSSHFYRNTKVRDISGSFRWAPFLALQKEDSFLTMLLLLSKYRMKSLPVVDLGEGKIENIITQSAVVHMLAECVDLHWFKNWGNKKLFELGLPIIKPEKVVKIKGLGQVSRYLCIEITRTASFFFLGQQKYLQQILQTTGMQGCKEVSTPLPMKVNPPIETINPMDEPTTCRQLTGSL